MSELGAPAAILLASLLLTYFICLRPMRQGKCVMSLGQQARAHSPRPPSTHAAELARLREEIEEMKASEAAHSSSIPPTAGDLHGPSAPCLLHRGVPAEAPR